MAPAFTTLAGITTGHKTGDCGPVFVAVGFDEFGELGVFVWSEL
jgi:hypothetical protein